jgi:hypothetical protein
MPADDVVISIIFDMKNQRGVNNAITRLQKLGVLSEINTTKVQQWGALGQASINRVNASATINKRKWEQVRREVERNVTAIRKYKATSNATLRTTAAQTTRVANGWSRVARSGNMAANASEKLRGISWKLTMASMGMLGVFFSMMSMTMALTKGFNLLVGPLMDIEAAAEMVGKAFAFNAMMGKDLSEIYGSIEDIMEGSVNTWKQLTALSTELKLGLTLLGIEVFKDGTVFDAVSPKITEFFKKLSTPEMVDAIQRIIIAFADMLPAISDMIPHIATLMEAMAPLVPYLFIASIGAALLMPLLSNLSMAFLILANVSGAWALVAKFALPIWVAIKAAAIAVAAAIGTVSAPIWLAIAAVAIIITYFGWWDDILRIVIGTLKWMNDMVQSLINLLMTGTWLERAGALLSLVSGPIGWAVGGTLAGDRGTTTKSDQTFNQTFNISETADAESVIDIVNDDMTYNLSG